MLDYLSIKEMAARTGLSEERIRQLIRTHEIKRAIKLGGWRVRTEDFEEFLRSRIYEGNGSDGKNKKQGGNGSDTPGRAKG